MPRRPQRDKTQPDAPRASRKAASRKTPAGGTARGSKSARKAQTQVPQPQVAATEQPGPPPVAPATEASPAVETAKTPPAVQALGAPPATAPSATPAFPLPAPAVLSPPAPLGVTQPPPLEDSLPSKPVLDFELSGTPVLLEDLLARHAEPLKPKRRWAGGGGLLVGLALAWHWQGAAGLAASHLNPAAAAQWPAQLALAWLALGLAGSAWANLHLQRDSSGTPADGSPHSSVPLTATLAGILVIASVALLTPWKEAHAAIAAEFFWTPLSLWLLDAVFVSLLFGPAWVVIGWLLGTMAIRSDAAHGSAGRALPAPALIGLGGGLLLGWLLARVGLTGQRQVLLGTLPLFGMAVLSARGSRSGPPAHSPVELSPHVATGNLRLLVISLFGSSAAIMLVLGAARSCLGLELGGAHWADGLALLSIGAAMGLTHPLADRLTRYDCGMALLGAGLSCALAGVVLTRWPTVLPVRWLIGLAVSVPPAIALALLLRAAAARLGGLTPTSFQAGVALSGAALGIAFREAWGQSALGSMGVWAAGALGLIACGSLVVIHEEERPTWMCRLRLAAVFGGLSLAIALLPGTARHWTRRTRELRAAMDAQPPAWQPDERRHLLQRVCCIGVHPTALEHWSAGAVARIEAMPFEEWAWTPPASRVVEIAASPAAACLRGSHQRYEVVYQRADLRVSGSSQCTAEWLGLLADHVSQGGQLVLETPAAQLDPAATAVLADTFEHVVGPACTWTMVERPTGRFFVLQGWPRLANCPRGQDGNRLEQLQQARGPRPQVHSLLRRGRGLLPKGNGLFH